VGSVTKTALKAKNTTWIWAVVVADAVALAGFAFPAVADQIASWLASARLAGASIAPVIVLLLTSILPTELKEALVFWRVRDVLPGHRAFSVYAQKDPRIDLARLRAAAGDVPAAARDQNSLWYRLYRQVEADPAVAQAHRHFLLFRDLAALSLLLAIIAPPALYALGAGATAVWLALALFGVQYLATALAGRFHGIRFVCNVLALHGAGTAVKAAPIKKQAGAASNDSAMPGHGRRRA
jgi:hypothetical protein